VQEALQGHPHLHACNFEFSLPRPSYTMQTLDALRAAYPDDTFILLIGADNWLCFPEWRDYERLIREYPILVYPRPPAVIDVALLPPSVRLLDDAPIFPISSTELRTTP
jgi:nicotinate-nucleotide adenylyltransferase